MVLAFVGGYLGRRGSVICRPFTISYDNIIDRICKKDSNLKSWGFVLICEIVNLDLCLCL